MRREERKGRTSRADQGYCVETYSVRQYDSYLEAKVRSPEGRAVLQDRIATWTRNDVPGLFCG